MKKIKQKSNFDSSKTYISFSKKNAPSILKSITFCVKDTDYQFLRWKWITLDGAEYCNSLFYVYVDLSDFMKEKKFPFIHNNGEEALSSSLMYNNVIYQFDDVNDMLLNIGKVYKKES